MTRIGSIVLTCVLVVAIGCSDGGVDANGDAGDAGHATEDTDGADDTGDTAQDIGDDGTDAGEGDAGAEDVGVEDAGAEDVGVEDAGAEDAGEGGDPCEGRTLGDDWLRLTTGVETCRYGDAMSGSYGIWMPEADCRYFEGVYPWPWDEQQSSQRVLGVQPDLNEGRQFIAMEFNTGALAPEASGQLNVNIPQADPLINRRKLMTMSTCPGDFNQEKIEESMGPGCYIESFVTNFRWGGTDHIDHEGRCGLEPDTAYYLNVIHTNAEMGTPIDELEPNEECLEDGCGFRMTPGGSPY